VAWRNREPSNRLGLLQVAVGTFWVMFPHLILMSFHQIWLNGDCQLPKSKSRKDPASMTFPDSSANPAFSSFLVK
jgi:hypothetical protein